MLWRERQHLRELFVHSGSCAKRVDQLHSGEGEVVLHFVLQLSEREREQLPQSLNLPGGGLTFPPSAWPIGRTAEAHDSSVDWQSPVDFGEIPSQLHRLRALPGMEFKFFRHNNCCLRWIESPRTARIVRGWTRRATNPGRTARAVAPANAKRLAAPPSQL